MSPQPITQNTLFYGDNLNILREYIASETWQRRFYPSSNGRQIGLGTVGADLSCLSPRQDCGQFIGPSRSWEMRATGLANELAVGCDKSAPTLG